MAQEKTETQAQIDLLNLYNDKILTAGITEANKEEEIVDIITDYAWTAQEFTKSSPDGQQILYTHDIPFCYAIERIQTINSGITNILNTLLGTTSAILVAGTKGLEYLLGSVVNPLSSSQSAATATPQKTPENPQPNGKETTTKPQNPEDAQKKEAPAQTNSSKEATAFKNFISQKDSILASLSKSGNDLANQITDRLAEGNLAGSDFLQPWKWLYFTKQTTKKYVFPTFNNNQLFNITNSWGEASGELVKFVKSVTEFFKSGAEIAYGVRQIADFLPDSNQTTQYDEYNIEQALGYNYKGQVGPEFPVNFVLYNTTRKDAWKKNYRFLVMFLLRNMPLRTSIFSYKPPLLYDLIVPGVKHLPLCYVANVQVTSLGHVRHLEGDNILKEIVTDAKYSKTLVPVPEAWQVTITFKCLIPDTMNLILNTTNFPINISTVTQSAS